MKTGDFFPGHRGQKMAVVLLARWQNDLHFCGRGVVERCIAAWRAVQNGNSLL